MQSGFIGGVRTQGFTPPRAKPSLYRRCCRCVAMQPLVPEPFARLSYFVGLSAWPARKRGCQPCKVPPSGNLIRRRILTCARLQASPVLSCFPVHCLDPRALSVLEANLSADMLCLSSCSAGDPSQPAHSPAPLAMGYAARSTNTRQQPMLSVYSGFTSRSLFG